ncbi:MAG: OmpA family protein [Alistipes sp.]
MKKCLFLWLVFVFAASNVRAQEAVDSMRVFYRRGFHNVDPSFRDNRVRLDRFLNSVNRALKENRVGKIVIRSYASPDGTAKANERLSERRAEELKAYLVREGNVPAALVEHHAEGIAWGDAAGAGRRFRRFLPRRGAGYSRSHARVDMTMRAGSSTGGRNG